MAGNLQSLVARLETAVGKLEGMVGSVHHEEVKVNETSVAPQVSQPEPSSASPVIASYSDSVLTKLSLFKDHGKKLNNAEINNMVPYIQIQVVSDAFHFVFDILKATENAKKPTQDELASLVFPKFQEFFSRADKFRDPRNDLKELLSALYEGVQASQWVVVDGPAGIVTSFIDATEYYGNNIRRTKIQDQVDFFLSFKDLLTATLQYVNANFKLGLNWNPKGDAFSSHFGKAVQSAPAAQPEPQSKAAAKPAAVKEVVKHEARKYERGISWIFDRYSNRKDLELEEVECGMKKGVMIENCDNCVFQIKGKVKTILISNCKSTGVIIQDVVSSVDIVNCNKIQIQATGKVPSIQIDKTDGCEIYLMTQGTFDDILIASCKSQDMTISFPDPKNPEEYKMEAIPHQFVHRLNAGKVVSEVSELYR